MIKNILAVCFLLMLNNIGFAQKEYTQYVNPFVGTGGHGHTYPGATLPHGMVQLSPDTRLDGWDGCSGYHYSDSFIYGFSHTHLSGTGVSDYGDILLMPMNGSPSPDNKIYGSIFSHKDESAAVGYYNVLLQKDLIRVELTATQRVGFHHYTFKNSTNNNVILDLKHRDEVIESSLNIEDSVTVSGLRRSRAWADNQYVYFVMKFSKPIVKAGVWQNEQLLGMDNKKVEDAKNLKAYFQFNLHDSKDVFIKVAISPVSVDGAKRNLEAELPGWDFEKTKNAAKEEWNKELSRIEIISGDEKKMSLFYTALYHTAIVPNINMDVDAQYRGRDNKIHKAIGFDYYSVFSLWDTYRAAHPLYTVIDRKRTLDYIKTFLAQYKEGGRLPVWELASCETDCMIGYHSIPVIADAFEKGIAGFDSDLALEAMKHSANRDVLGLPAYTSKGMIEIDDESESVSKTLEYAYDDWCIAKFARRLGNDKDYTHYMNRAQYYKNLLDVRSGFMRPKKNADWLKPFDPREVNSHYTEANSWQYSFYMPQDISGYLAMIGGNKKLERKLDSLFTTSSKTTGRDQSDITGLIGQYAHGNEPSHHIIYLYNYTGKQYKTQQLVHKVMTEMYLNAPDGLIGNEDCGQMSAWYVMSALGFYPVTPASNRYMIGSPQFNLAQINLENGKTFIINSPGVSDRNYYIQNVFLSTSAVPPPHNWDSSYLHHSDIANGGLITFMMGDKPSRVYPKGFADLAIIAAEQPVAIVVNPVISGGPVPFRKNKLVALSSPQKAVSIYFTLDGTVPDTLSKKYVKPIMVDTSLTIKAVAVNANKRKSFVVKADYRKVSHDWFVKLNTPFEQLYSADGAEGLIDGIRGTLDWHKGNWQGYQKNNFDAVIDMKQPGKISKVSAGFLQDTRAWIVLPSKLLIEVSSDGKNYRQVYSGSDFLPVDDLNPQIKNIEAVFPELTARYIRIKAEQFGKLPSWHEGAGGDTHIFVDEIIIN